MKRITFLLAILICIISCRNEKPYYPEKHGEVTMASFKRYKGRLDTAYMNNDLFTAGIQLANLKAPSDEVFKLIRKGIKSNSENCKSIYDWQSIYNDFKNNLVKNDTTQFKMAFELCLELLGDNSYPDYLEEKHNAYLERMASRQELDSTKFDLELIAELETIRFDDQELRTKTDFDNLSDDESKVVWQKIGAVDSINLMKIEAIFKKYGYPQKELVGYELTGVPWLVLHHQSDLKIRDKYQKLIEENVSAGMLKTYNWRSNNIREELENVGL